MSMNRKVLCGDFFKLNPSHLYTSEWAKSITDFSGGTLDTIITWYDIIVNLLYLKAGQRSFFSAVVRPAMNPNESSHRKDDPPQFSSQHPHLKYPTTPNLLPESDSRDEPVGGSAEVAPQLYSTDASLPPHRSPSPQIAESSSNRPDRHSSASFSTPEIPFHAAPRPSHLRQQSFRTLLSQPTAMQNYMIPSHDTTSYPSPDPPVILPTENNTSQSYFPFLSHAPPPENSWIEVETLQHEYKLHVRLPGFTRDGITLATKKRRILHVVANKWENGGGEWLHCFFDYKFTLYYRPFRTTYLVWIRRWPRTGEGRFRWPDATYHGSQADSTRYGSSINSRSCW